MLSEKDKREAWKIYSQKRKGNKPFRGISHEDSKARRVAYIFLNLNKTLSKDQFNTWLQIADEIPEVGDSSNKQNRFENRIIKEFSPIIGKSDASWTPARNDRNEPKKDDEYFAPRPELNEGDWTPANTNSSNFAWLNKVANLFELPGAAKDEDVPFLQKVKEIRDQQKQEPGQQQKTSWLDYAQMGLDVAGIFEPTPISDGINAGISVLRAVAEPKNAGNHLVNAGISLASMVPYVGDFAKVYKSYGKGISAVEHLGKMKNNKSRLGRMASIAYDSLGGGSLDRMNGASRSSNGGIGNPIPGGGGSSLGNWMPGGGGGDNGGAVGGLLSASGGGWSANIPKSVQSTFGVFSKLTGVVGVVVSAFQQLSKWVDKTSERGQEMLEEQRAGARWSPVASGAMLQYDLSKIRREGERGRYLGPSTAYLAKSNSFVESEMSKYTMPYARAASNIQASLNTVAGYIAMGLNKMDILQNILEFAFGFWEEKQNVPANPIDAFQQNPNPIPTNPKKFDFDKNNNKAQRGFI